MKRISTSFINLKNVFLSALSVLLINISFAQTNVFDDVISTSPNHTYLTAAITQQGLQGALQNPSATLTVFAPTNAAFDNLAASLGTDISGILALSNLTDVLLYHVLGITAVSGDLSNGLIVTPLNDDNTLKITVKGNGDVFVNQAQVTTANLSTNNGVVHVTDAVLLSASTVADVAIDNGFSTLVSAVIVAELLPALSDPFGTYTVFAPTNLAFEALAIQLGVNVADLLILSNLADILLYHVLGAEVNAADVTNGLLATPLNDANTIKMTVTSNGNVFANQAEVILADVSASNGVVHVINAVILENETVVDLALDNPGFSVLTAAVISLELLPVLTNPFATLTVLAPTDAAFGALLAALDITAEDLLNDEDLLDIVLYHVFDTQIEAADLSNGLIAQPLSQTNNLKVTVASNGNVFFNQAQVEMADVAASNGLVHVLNSVLLPVETVVDVAIDNGFSYLTAAVVQEELVPVLSNPLAQFTVFAPTNEAFDALALALSTDIAGLLALENLTNVLLYHVVGSALEASDLVVGNLNTVLGQPVAININAGTVTVNSATVTLADVLAFNGVVHVINQVLIPGNVSIVDNDLVDVVVFPNPTSEFISFEGLPNTEFVIVDAIGNEVLRNTYSGNPIEIKDLSQGIYFISFPNEPNAGAIRLFIK